MYADTITPSMKAAIEETNRRREKQIAYNAEMGIDPQPLRKRIADILDDIVRGEEAELIGGSGRQQSRGKTPVPGMASRRARNSTEQSSTAGQHAAELANMPKAELALLIQQLQDQMHAAAAELQFELAARLRDEVNELKREFRAMEAAGIN
jgi:excinuclease ABC subunit B